MNTPATAIYCFYVHGDHHIIDTVTDENPPRGHYSGKTLEQVQERYPNAQIVDFNYAGKEIDDAVRQPAEEITEETFMYMLEVLPPMGWIQRAGSESFKMSEMQCGLMTGIYCRIGKRYFMLIDSVLLKHEQIVAMCEEARDGR